MEEQMKSKMDIAALKVTYGAFPKLGIPYWGSP